MPFLHLINHEKTVVFSQVVGTVSFEDITTSLINLGNSPDIPDNYHFLIDIRRCKIMQSFEQAQTIVNTWKLSKNKFSQKVILLATTPALYGEMRMTATLAQIRGFNATVAGSESEACSLLDLSEFPTNEQFDNEGISI